MLAGAPREGSTRRAELINATFGPFILSLIREAEALADNPHLPNKDKERRIMAVADTFSEFINTQTVCRQGCSHCCYQAVAVNTREARMIAEYTGRAPAKIDDSYETYLANQAYQKKYNRVACTFLVEGRCSIYPVRPIVCRTHHSIEDTPDWCNTQGIAQVGVMNVQRIIHAFYNIPFTGVSDIREYFPKEPT